MKRKRTINLMRFVWRVPPSLISRFGGLGRTGEHAFRASLKPFRLELPPSGFTAEARSRPSWTAFPQTYKWVYPLTLISFHPYQFWCNDGCGIHSIRLHCTGILLLIPHFANVGLESARRFRLCAFVYGTLDVQSNSILINHYPVDSGEGISRLCRIEFTSSP